MLEGVFTRKKAEASHFRIFCSIAYFHVPYDKHTKLDQISENWFFVGCSDTSKAYRIYIPSNRKIVVR